jgi:hypothetical protein
MCLDIKPNQNLKIYSKTCSILNKNVKHGEKKVKHQAKAKGDSKAKEGLQRTIENLEKNTLFKPK